MAEEKLHAAFGVPTASSGQSLNGQLVSQIFIAANRRIFAVVFWFIVLGPVGAVLYRLITLSSADFPQQRIVPQLVSNARVVESVLDWVPVRIFAGILALSGHCVQVLSCWRKKAGLSLHLNEVLLTECGAAALGGDDINPIAEDGSATKHAISLLDRSLVITVVAVALLVLIM
jgi:membrane protein required for beta-lactamase induction